MKITLALIIITFLAFSGYHLTFRHFRMPLFARGLYLSGTEFLLLGVLLGPQFLNILDVETQKGLCPLTAFVLGWIGLFFGFQFEINKLRRFPLEHFIAATAEGIMTFLLVFVGVYLTITLYFDIPGLLTISIAITLAAAAGCTVQTGLALLPQNVVSKNQDTVKLLKFISSVDGLGPLLLFGLCFFYTPLTDINEAWLSALGQGILISFGAGFGLLLLFATFLSHRHLEKELILIVIGMTILSSGFASAIGFSPLLTNFFVGFGLVNLSRDKERIYHILISIEKPTYLLLLVFTGVNVKLDSLWIFLFGALYFLYRFVAKLIAGGLTTRLTPTLRKHPTELGLGLLAQGGLSLAILLDYHQTFYSPVSTLVISLSVPAIIYNEFLSNYFLERLFIPTLHKI